MNAWGLMAKIWMSFLTHLNSSPGQCKSGPLHCAKPTSENPEQNHKPPSYAATPDCGYTIVNSSLFPQAKRLQITKKKPTPKPNNKPTKSKELSAKLFPDISKKLQIICSNRAFFQLKWQDQKNLCSCIFIFLNRR